VNRVGAKGLKGNRSTHLLLRALVSLILADSEERAFQRVSTFHYQPRSSCIVIPKPRKTSSRVALVAILTLFALWSLVPLSRAAEDRWWGEITDISPDGDTYTVQLEDGREVNVEWVAGYSDWDVGDRVILTVDSGFGFMVYGTRHTYVSVEEAVEAVPDDYRRVSAAFPEPRCLELDH
jgi:hypothetical protein